MYYYHGGRDFLRILSTEGEKILKGGGEGAWDSATREMRERLIACMTTNTAARQMALRVVHLSLL